MLVCQDCGCLFDSPKIIKESRGEFWGMPCYEDVSVCPSCGSDDFNLRSAHNDDDQEDIDDE